MIISGGQPRYDRWKNGRVPALLNHVDIAPTTLGLCGIAKPDWMAGSDYSHYRIDKSAEHPDPDSAYLQSIIPVGGRDTMNTPYRGLVTDDGWKYVCFNNFSWLMFNLNDDPYEESNLAYNNAYRDERRKLIARLKQWFADTRDAFTVPAD
jgi:arylsulfatase A-like enzyme